MRGNPAGVEFIVPEGEEHLIGRQSPATILIPDDSFLSSQHAVVSWAGDGFAVRDLNSATGTKINGRSITESRLLDGDELRVGESALRASIRKRLPANASGTGKAAAEPPRPEVSADLKQTTGYRSNSAKQLSERFRLGAEYPAIAQLAQGEAKPEAVVKTLIEASELEAAIRFLAHALPQRTAIAWAAACIRDAKADDISETDRQHVERCEAWAQEPTEQNRRAAMDAVVDGDMETSSEWAAMAVGFADGSIGPDGAPVVKADESLCGRTVAGVIEVCCLESQPELAPEKRKRYLAAGLKLARGDKQEQLWVDE